MNPEPQREVRSFLVGREPSVDRRFRPRPQRQFCLSRYLKEISDDEESYDENSEPGTSSYIRHPKSDDDSTTSDTALVYLRMRPLQSPSNIYAIQENVLIVKPSSDSMSTSNNKNSMDRHFVFTDIFHPEIPQSSVYDNCIRAQIEAEESFTLLTYGTSGSGKTYTLLGSENQPGMVPRALEHIFSIYEPKLYPTPSIKLINGRITLIEDNELVPDLNLRKRLLRDCVETPEIQESRLKITNDHQFNPLQEEDTSVLIWISFVEIYNANVYDLLEAATTTTQMAPPPRKNLKILGNDGKAFIKGVTSVYVKSSVEALFLLRSGLQRVSYASTSINKNSSRSHCIFLIDVLKFFRSGQFSETSYKFCDLAGSERLHKTGNVGSRLKEAQRINTSLLVLGRCLDAATSSRRKNGEIIPFRESKLTMLLQAALLGKEKLTMIVNIMPTEQYYEENINVLGFASIAKDIVLNQSAAKTQKQRCSFFLSYPQSQRNNSEEFQQVLEENIFLRNEIGRLAALHAEELFDLEHEIRQKLAALHAEELFDLEHEIRQKLADSHENMLKKMKTQYDERLKAELESQKREMELKFQSITRKYEWEIEDLREELEKKSPNKRRTVE